MIGIGYVFKPRKSQVDRVAHAVSELRHYGINLNVSRFYEYAVDKALCEFDRSPTMFVQEFRLAADTKNGKG